MIFWNPSLRYKVDADQEDEDEGHAGEGEHPPVQVTARDVGEHHSYLQH